MAKKNVIPFPGNKTRPKVNNVTAAMNNARNMAASGRGPADPNMTINVDNSKLNEVLRAYVKDNSPDNLNKLINVLVGCRILIPAAITPGKNPSPKLIKAEGDKIFLPIYTDKDQIPEEHRKPAVINLPFVAANQVALNPIDEIKGIAINPFTDNLVFHKPLLEKIDEVEKKKKELKDNATSKEAKLKEALPGAQFGKDENGNTTLKLNEKQYVQFERTEFEVGYLPKKLFSDGQSFIDKLIEEKADYIDSMYEDSYQQKRMYPFIPEDFSILSLEISETLTIITIDMPEKDIAFGNAYRVYIAWNTDTLAGRYFRIVQGKEKGEIFLEEIRADKSIQNLGPAPAEGSELTKIIELVSGE